MNTKRNRIWSTFIAKKEKNRGYLHELLYSSDQKDQILSHKSFIFTYLADILHVAKAYYIIFFSLNFRVFLKMQVLI